VIGCDSVGTDHPLKNKEDRLQHIFDHLGRSHLVEDAILAGSRIHNALYEPIEIGSETARRLLYIGCGRLIRCAVDTDRHHRKAGNTTPFLSLKAVHDPFRRKALLTPHCSMIHDGIGAYSALQVTLATRFPDRRKKTGFVA
jgi:hypothetical protein